jgi:signal transduction histidine kinase
MTLATPVAFPLVWFVAAAVVVILIQSALMAGVVLQQSRRRRVEAALLGKEEALRVSQEDARRLAGRLISAQELERARIARELHDDISQRVALLELDIKQIAQSDAPGLRGRSRIMSQRAAEIASDLHNMSQELHPASLERLGLVKATQSVCRELGARHHLDIDFVHDHVPQSVPPDSALCLFRIAQEALQNVVKHSAARNSAVRLSGSADSLRLEISDSGCGFDTSKPGNGMGLLNMSARANFLGGQMTIRSMVGSGTRIDVRVPNPRTKPSAGLGAAGTA